MASWRFIGSKFFSLPGSLFPVFSSSKKINVYCFFFLVLSTLQWTICYDSNWRKMCELNKLYYNNMNTMQSIPVHNQYILTRTTKKMILNMTGKISRELFGSYLEMYIFYFKLPEEAWVKHSTCHLPRLPKEFIYWSLCANKNHNHNNAQTIGKAVASGGELQVSSLGHTEVLRGHPNAKLSAYSMGPNKFPRMRPQALMSSGPRQILCELPFSRNEGCINVAHNVFCPCHIYSWGVIWEG